MFDVDFERIVVVGEVDQIPAAVKRTHALQRVYFIVVQEHHLQFAQGGQGLSFRQLGDVVM